jgi:hypothetical protein
LESVLRPASIGGTEFPTHERPTMRGNPLLNFHRAAEAASYPALLIVSAVSLALVVAPVGLLALVETTGALALSVLGMVLALALLAAELDAALSDANEPAEERLEKDTRGADPAAGQPDSAAIE